MASLSAIWSDTMTAAETDACRLDAEEVFVTACYGLLAGAVSYALLLPTLGAAAGPLAAVPVAGAVAVVCWGLLIVHVRRRDRRSGRAGWRAVTDRARNPG